MPGRPSLFVYLSSEERHELHDLLRHPRTPVRTRDRIHLVLQSDDNRSLDEIARTSHFSRTGVYYVLRRFLERRFEGLFDRERPGRAPVLTPEMRSRVLVLARDEKHGHNARTIAEALLAEFGIEVARTTLNDHLRRLGLTWQRSRYVPGGEPEPEMAAETVSRLDALKGGLNSGWSNSGSATSAGSA